LTSLQLVGRNGEAYSANSLTIPAVSRSIPSITAKPTTSCWSERRTPHQKTLWRDNRSTMIRSER